DYYVAAVGRGFERQSYPAMIAIILVGVCIGFLLHNFNPARVFMGDTGSMLLGLLLASITISVTGLFLPDREAAAADGMSGFHALAAFLPVLLPLLVLALPLAGLALAVVRRSLAGQAPFAADRQTPHPRTQERAPPAHAQV